MNSEVRALVLAAGSSRRFGKQKLCEKLPSGITILDQTLNRIKIAVPDITVVTSIQVYENLQTQKEEFEIFKQATSGMGATLSYGIRLIKTTDACLICLADMPFIQASTYRRLAAVLTPENIVVPVYRGTQGNPVGFGRRFFKELMQLNEDTGGHALLLRYSSLINHVEVDDPAILHDIDTPADLAKYVDTTS